MKTKIISILEESGMEVAEITDGSYVAEWVDRYNQIDYDFVLRYKHGKLLIFHPIGRPTIENHNEISNVVGNILFASFCNLTIHQQDDGDLMLYREVTTDEAASIPHILLEMCRYKEEIRRSYVWKQLLNDDIRHIRKKVNCDWCGNVAERFKVFQSLEVCQECYLHFPKCNSCYSVIGHSLNESVRIGRKRYCNNCYALNHKCSYCNEPLNILYFLDDRNNKPLCFKCRTHQEVPDSDVNRALPIVLNIIRDLFNLDTEQFYNFEICSSTKLQERYQLTGKYNYLTHKIHGLFDGQNIYLSSNLSLQAYIEVISHEYFHYLQRKYLPGWVELGIIEGFAMWGESLVQRYVDDKQSLKSKDRVVVSTTVYESGMRFFQFLEKKHGIHQVWDWMKIVKPFSLDELIVLEKMNIDQK